MVVAVNPIISQITLKLISNFEKKLQVGTGDSHLFLATWEAEIWRIIA
jgi:hypothetical protein